jgi:omega-6 fatty acid desaturase (delta-12 desaturase)
MDGTTAAATPPKTRPHWREGLAPHTRADVPRALLGLATSVPPYVALVVLMYRLTDVSVLAVLALSVPAAGFLLRTFMMFHDCAHGSLLPTKRANAWVGRTLGVLVFQPFQSWRHSHAVHHATAADLDRRGVGDVPTLTVDEYLARSWRGRLAYRLFRSPLIMFGIGPLYAMILLPRFVSRSARPRIRRSIIGTDVAIVALFAGLCAVAGWRDVLLVQGPIVLLGGAAGVFLFYVQHQFEGTYWEQGDGWSFADAALRGSSYLKLPEILRFFTASIGLHHVHHLSAAIPNYNLQRAHDETALFHDVPELSLLDAFRAVRLKLWDPRQQRLVTFAEARAQAAPPVLTQGSFSNTSR